jgi:hypothetical protein
MTPTVPPRALQDKAKPRPFPVVDRVLRLELGAGAEEVFAEFSAEATAAASLAQVCGSGSKACNLHNTLLTWSWLLLCSTALLGSAR